jgi:hypothetical protein
VSALRFEQHPQLRQQLAVESVSDAYALSGDFGLGQVSHDEDRSLTFASRSLVRLIRDLMSRSPSLFLPLSLVRSLELRIAFIRDIQDVQDVRRVSEEYERENAPEHCTLQPCNFERSAHSPFFEGQRRQWLSRPNKGRAR